MFDSVKAHLFPSLIGLQPSFSLLSLLSPIYFPLACIHLIRKPSRHSSGFVFSLSYLSIFFFLLSYLATCYQTKVRRRDRSTLLHLPALPTALCPATCPTCRRAPPRRYSASYIPRRNILALQYSAPPRRWSTPLLADDIPQTIFRIHCSQTIFRIQHSAPQYFRAAILRAAQTLVHATARSLVRPPLFRPDAGLRPCAALRLPTLSCCVRSTVLTRTHRFAACPPVCRGLLPSAAAALPSLAALSWPPILVAVLPRHRSSVLLPPALYSTERNRRRFSCLHICAADSSPHG